MTESTAKSEKTIILPTIQNGGGFAAPVDIVVTYADGASETFHQTPAIWEQN